MESSWSNKARQFARDNGLVVSNIVGMKRYRFRDLRTGFEAPHYESCYRSVLRAMQKYVASKRGN